MKPSHYEENQCLCLLLEWLCESVYFFFFYLFLLFLLLLFWGWWGAGWRCWRWRWRRNVSSLSEACEKRGIVQVDKKKDVWINKAPKPKKLPFSMQAQFWVLSESRQLYNRRTQITGFVLLQITSIMLSL